MEAHHLITLVIAPFGGLTVALTVWFLRQARCLSEVLGKRSTDATSVMTTRIIERLDHRTILLSKQRALGKELEAGLADLRSVLVELNAFREKILGPNRWEARLCVPPVSVDRPALPASMYDCTYTHSTRSGEFWLSAGLRATMTSG